MTELRRAVMLDLPPCREAGALRRSRFVDGIEDKRSLVILAPWLGSLNLAKNVELHTVPLFVTYNVFSLRRMVAPVRRAYRETCTCHRGSAGIRETCRV